jgi:hypothetical protein
MKRYLCGVLAALFLLCAVPIRALATTGDPNIVGGGGGMVSGTSSNYWNPGDDGVRVSVVKVENRAIVGTPVDLANGTPTADSYHFGKVNKLQYNSGRSISPVQGGYVSVRPTQALPRIISSGSYPASITVDPELMIEDGYINAYIGTWFDVDERFGTHTYGTDDYVNFYADYYPGDERLEAYYVLHHADGSDSDPVPVELADSEKNIILEQMREQGLDECVRELEQDAEIKFTGMGE